MTVIIHTTPQSFRVAATPSFQLLEAPSLSLYEFCKPYVEFTYDHNLSRYVPLRFYRFYNARTRQLHLPLYDLSRFKEFLTQHRVVFHEQPVALSLGKPVKILLNPEFTPRTTLQAGAVEYLTTANDPVRGLALQTGCGKTYTAITAVAKLGRRPMILCSGLIDQWMESLAKFTCLLEDEVYTIQGFDSLLKLYRDIDTIIDPKVILCSIPTIHGYIHDKEDYLKAEIPPPEEMFNRLNVGIRVTDEVHLRFHTNLMIDLRTNASINMPLTATFDNTTSSIKRIFDAHYPVSMRYGEAAITKYIHVHAYRYALKFVPPYAYKSREGYSHVMFENWLIKHIKTLEHIWRTVYQPMIDSHYMNVRKPHHRLLILCSTTDMCYQLERYVKQTYPKLTTSVLISGVSKTVLDQHDVIISTPGSAGTGTDIRNLKTVLLTISINSPVTNKQIMGRLRQLKDEPNSGDPVLCYPYCCTIPQHERHHLNRSIALGPLAKTYHEHSFV